MTENVRTERREGTPLPLLRVAITVFLPFAGGYFLSYLYRSVNAVIAPDLVRDVGISAADLGLLTSAYFLAFAAFQLPLGLLLDRFGPRRVQGCLLLSAALGAAVFAMAQSLPVLIIGRALIGLGVAGGLMASFKAVVLWFPPHRWPLVNGCFLTAGGLGALSATAPVEAALHVTDWRGVFLILSLATVIVSMAIFLVVPERSAGEPAQGLRRAIAGLGTIYRDRLFWRLAPVSIATMAFGMAFQGLWAGPWLADVAGLGRTSVANHLFLLGIALTAGFLLGGWVADFLARRGISLMHVVGVGSGLLLAMQLPLLSGGGQGLLVVLIGVGLLSNINVLVYPLLSAHFTQALSARANTALNLLLFLAAFGAQYAIGAIIDLWPAAEGRYPAVAYQTAFGGMVAVQLLGWLWFLAAARRSRRGAA